MLLVIVPISDNRYLASCVMSATGPLDCDTVQSVVKRYTSILHRIVTSAPDNVIVAASAIQIAASNIRVTSTPYTAVLTSASTASLHASNPRQCTVHRLTTLLCALLAHAPDRTAPAFGLHTLPRSAPNRFHIVYGHKLTLDGPSRRALPVTTLMRLSTLLNG